MIFFKPNFWAKNKISFFSFLLFPVSFIIKLLIIFKKKFIKNHTCSIPIICVGNIYLGGTGKTPLCIEIFTILKSLNMNPVFIRKKYNSYQDEVNLQQQSGPVFQNKKRIEAVREAAKNKANIAILDDGFQDFSINKDLSIVCFNEKQWIGNGLTIPSGPLRENLSSLKRANCIVINGNKNRNIENEIIKNNKQIKIFYSKYVPTNLDLIKDKKVIAFAGIGNPENFFYLLNEYNVNVIDTISFPDHYNYKNEELEKLINKTKQHNSILLTTEKDYLRINEDLRKKINYLKIKTKIENKNEFVNEIKKII
jgi:tetraacyldisaccharide 4'-kinase